MKKDIYILYACSDTISNLNGDVIGNLDGEILSVYLDREAAVIARERAFLNGEDRYLSIIKKRIKGNFLLLKIEELS